jgi:hypothetical protein
LPHGITISNSNSNSYADIARKLKYNIDLARIEVKIDGITKTKSGDTFLRVGRSAKVQKVAVRLKEAVGPYQSRTSSFTNLSKMR